jgi:HlyD family secretion protein
MKKRLILLIPIVLIAGLALTGMAVFRNGGDDGTIRVSGNIDVTSVRLGFRIPGTLESRQAGEGDPVTAGQLLATLESSDQKAALARAEALVAYHASVLDELLAGTRPQDLDRAKAELERSLAAAAAARVQLEQARSDTERFEALYQAQTVSQRDAEQFQTRFQTAEHQYREAQARVTNARKALSLSEEGPRKETLDQARARLAEANAAMEQARIRLADTRLISPMDGVVLTEAAEVGEYVNPGSAVLVVGDLARPWVRAYITERDLGRIRLNEQATIRIDAWPDRTFPGTVTYIADQAEFTPKSVQTFEERVKLMFRITIDLDNPEGLLKPGMPADAILSPAAPPSDRP